MRSALKIKIHNAINSAILADSEDRGIFVGGRRRNRKKKRTKHGNITYIRTGSSRCMLQRPSKTFLSSALEAQIARWLWLIPCILWNYYYICIVGIRLINKIFKNIFVFLGGLFVFCFCICKNISCLMNATRLFPVKYICNKIRIAVYFLKWRLKKRKARSHRVPRSRRTWGII